MDNTNQIIIDLMSAMRMQVMRERDLAHIPSHTAKFIWDEAYEKALDYLIDNRATIPEELKQDMWT